jgi:hypothetical protein
MGSRYGFQLDVTKGGLTMAENEVKTITISVEEYFDLRERAQMNLYLVERLGQIDVQIRDLNRRVIELERMERAE